MTKKDIAVLGLGTFGFELAIKLEEQGHTVLAVDKDEKTINRIKDSVSVAIVADFTDEEVLKKLDISQFNVVILAISSALESVILALTHMKNMGVKHIIGKANNRIIEQILRKVGADEIVTPEIWAADKLAEQITHPHILEKFMLTGKDGFFEVKVPSKFHGKTLRELDLRKKHGISVIMKKTEEKMQSYMNPDEPLNTGNIMFVIGDEKKIHEIFKEE